MNSRARKGRGAVALFAKIGSVLLVSGGLLVWLFVTYLPVVRPEFARLPTSSRAPHTLATTPASPASPRPTPRGKTLSVKGAEFRPRLSSKSFYEGETLVIAGLRRGEAVAAREMTFDADNYSFLKVSSSGFSPGLRMFLFWHTLERPDGVFYAQVPLKPDGRGWFNLRREALWQGTVSKIEVGIYGDLRGREFRLQRVEFVPYGAVGAIGTLWTEWRAFTPWQHASINSYTGTAQTPLVWLAPAFTAWLVLALSLAGSYGLIRKLWRGKRPITSPATGAPRRSELKQVCFGGAFTLWGGLILLWMAHLGMQFEESRYQFAGKDYHEKRMNDWDGPYYKTAYDLKKALATKSGTISLLMTPDIASALSYRTRFHLLPEWATTQFSSFDDSALHYALFNSRYTLILTGASPAQRQSYIDIAKTLGRSRESQGEARNIRVLAELARGILLEASPIAANPATPQERDTGS